MKGKAALKDCMPLISSIAIEALINEAMKLCASSAFPLNKPAVNTGSGGYIKPIFSRRGGVPFNAKSAFSPKNIK